MTDLIQRLNAALEGRYRVERELGEGGMAVVFLADDLRHERKVAVKVLKPELAAVVGADRFLAEIKTTANLQHPHILPLYDSGEADGFLFYVMPYVEGETLRERIHRERQLPVDDAVRVSTAVANALHAAHEAGVIHRDIKPGNILLTRGEPLVADFGIALAVGAAGGSRLTETGLSLGTPYYMSPEQATGDQTVGAASDTYSLACVLYEMLAGEPPYPGSTAQAVLGKIIQSGPVSVRESRPSVPEHVDAAIRKGLEKIPGDRFRDARELGRALSDPAFRHGDSQPRAGTGSGRRWSPVTAVLATLVVLFGGYTAWTLLPRPADSTWEHFPSPYLEGQGPITDVWGNFSVSRYDGSMSAFVGRGEQGGTQLWLRRWAELDARPIPGTEGGLDPDISPDGTEIAFMMNIDVRVAPIDGGPVRTLMRGTSPIWDDEQEHIYARIGALGTARVPAGGGPVDTISRVQEGEVMHYPTDVLPGGEKLLLRVIMEEGPEEIRVVDLESGETRFLVNAYWANYVASGHLVFYTQGALVAAPFDPDAAEITGPTVPVVGNMAGYSVSRDGQLLYRNFTGNPNPMLQLVWLTRDGAVVPVDTTWTFADGDGGLALRLSPDGSRVVMRVAVEGSIELWVKELDTGPQWRLTFDDALEWWPEWTPDGESVTYGTGPNRHVAIHTHRADGRGEPEMLVESDQSFGRGFWSPDGEWLILRSASGVSAVHGRSIMAMRPGIDEAPQSLIPAEADEVYPALSPDGRWVAYSSNVSGEWEVYVRPFPDAASGIWQISTRGGIAPRWSADGSELFFENGDRSMMAASVDGSGTAFAFEPPRVLFPIPEGIAGTGFALPFDVTPDGQRFLMAQNVRDPSTGRVSELVLVRGFDQMLRERVGN